MATREQILERLTIGPDDWILEIGSGNWPYSRSDILADRYMFDDTERWGPIVVDRPMVICDAHALPFVNHAFDYVFASQILEHLEDPVKFFAEIERIGKAGYIETPNELRERLFRWPFHKWVARVEDGALILRPNDIPAVFGDLFHQFQQHNYSFGRFCNMNHDLLNVCFEWTSTVKYRVLGSNDTDPGGQPDWWVTTLGITVADMEKDSRPAPPPPPPPIRARDKVREAIEWRLEKYLPWIFRRPIEDIEDIPNPDPVGKFRPRELAMLHLKSMLACPICQVPIDISSWEAGVILCPQCGREYAVRQEIPIMLPDEGECMQLAREMDDGI